MKNKYEAFKKILIYKAFVDKQTNHNIYQNIKVELKR
jgi:hypothetical protein